VIHDHNLANQLSSKSLGLTITKSRSIKKQADQIGTYDDSHTREPVPLARNCRCNELHRLYNAGWDGQERERLIRPELFDYAP